MIKNIRNRFKNLSLHKKNFILFILISGAVSVYALTIFPSSGVTYDNSTNGLVSTNVQGAIDELYNMCSVSTEPEISGGDYVIDKIDLVTSGDGLYKDEYEEGRYFYKGANPNNYIIFSGELWRILSIEADGRIKIIRCVTLGDTYRYSSGSSDWATSYLNVYTLNDQFKNRLYDKDKIATSSWNIGKVGSEIYDLSTAIEGEKSNTWSGDIALITLSEYIRSNSNKRFCGSISSVTNESFFNMCKTTSWLFQGSFWGWWMLTPASHYQVYMSSMEGLAAIVDLDGEGGLDVLPALYLKSDTKLAGSGTDSNPFYIID